MKLIQLLVKRKIIVGLFLILLLIIGLFSFSNLKLEMLPQVQFEGAGVGVSAPQLSAYDVETIVMTELENVVANIDGVSTYVSVSAIGSGYINVEFEKAKADDAYTELESLMKGMEAQLSDVTHISTYRHALSDDTAVFMDIYGGDMDDMSVFAKNIAKPRLEALPEVKRVSLQGIKEYEILVEVDQSKSKEYGIDLHQLSQLIMMGNVTEPLGEIGQDEEQAMLRWDTRFSSIADVEEIQIPTQEGMISLKEIATVKLKKKDGDTESWRNGEPNFISLYIIRTANATESAVTDAVRAEVEKIKEEGLVEGFYFEELVVRSEFISSSVENVKQNIWIGGLLAFAVVFLFLRNIRGTFIVGLSIPLSLLSTIIVMNWIDYSFNLVTLISLGLGIGMMVDASIVIFESIYRKRQEGSSLRDAVLEGIREVGGAVIASMLTTVVVFVPLGLLSDPFLGTLMQIMSMVIVITLVSSVIISFTIIPVLSDKFLKLKKRNKEQQQTKITHAYGNVIGWLSAKKWRRWVVLLLFTAVFASSLLLIPKIPSGVIPDVYNRQAEVVILFDNGTTPEIRANIAEEIHERMEQIPDIKSYNIFAGTSNAWLFINMTPEGEATETQDEINRLILANLREMQEEHPMREVGMGTDMNLGGGSPIQVRIQGSDLEQLRQLAEQLSAEVANVDGILSVSHTLSESVTEQKVILKEEEIENAGLLPHQIREYFNLLLSKHLLGEMEVDGESLPIYIQNNLSIQNMSQLEEQLMDTPVGERKLGQFFEVEELILPIEISHLDGERFVNVMADKDETDIGSIRRDIEELISQLEIPASYTITLGGQLAQQQESAQEMIYIFLIAIFLVYMVMAVQFNSFIHPFVVMSIIPMTMTGALLGLFITQRELNLMSGVGILMLIGIILNNAILLIDRTKQLRNEGEEISDALVEACKSRVRPIFMTTLTTSFGMLPLALATGNTSSFQSPMATAVIFGLLFATMITLVLVPSVYLIFEDILGWPKRFMKKRQQKMEDAVEA